jgi:hypothetical protein
LASGPKLAVEPNGRVWLTFRNRLNRFDNAVGACWLNFLTTLEGDRWRQAFPVPGTDALLHGSVVLLPAAPSGLYVLGWSDGRFRDAAFFNRSDLRKRRRGLPPITTRRYPRYPDELFNMELTLADTGPVAGPESEPKLVRIERPEPAGPAEAAEAEAERVAAMRALRVEVGGRRLRLARGEFHRHTEISHDGGGDGCIFDMWRYALDLASLDWIGCGDHDNGGGREFTWWFTQKTTSLFTLPGSFTPVYSYERSCGYPDGHRNAVFARRGVRPLGRLRGGRGKPMDNLPADAPRPNSPDTIMFFKYLAQFGGICASHTSATNMGTDWRDYDPKVEPVIEIYQGCRQSYERPGAPRSASAEYAIGGWRPLGFAALALLKGYRLGFQASSDHISTHISYCNVWVDELGRQQVVDGMRARHVYGSTDNIIAVVRCGEHFMGDEFTVNRPPTLHVRLIGTQPFDEVVIVKDNEYVYSISPKKREVEFSWTDAAAKPGKTSYYYIRGRQVGETTTRTVSSAKGKKVQVQIHNGELVWVSPMWITYKP